jgi:phosphate transport system protein
MADDSRHFADELNELKSRVLVMGGLAEEAVRRATQSLLTRNAQVARSVIESDHAVNALHMEIDNRSFKLLALYQPMAIDLRTIVAAVKINADLERIGDLAVNIAEATARYIQHPPVKPLIDLPRMAALALRMLRDALDAFVSGRTDAAEQVVTDDDMLDALKNQILRELLTYMLGESTTIEPSLDLILISRHLERIGDHATNISEDVIFIFEGRDVRRQPPVHPRGPDGNSGPHIPVS